MGTGEVNVSLCLTNVALCHEDLWRSECIIHVFLTSALVGAKWSASRSCRYTPWERAPSSRFMGGWVDTKPVLNDTDNWKFLNLLGLELQTKGGPARSQSPYRLRYRASYCKWKITPFNAALIFLKKTNWICPIWTHSFSSLSGLFPNAALQVLNKLILRRGVSRGERE
jgi:hypothetical protein